MYKGISGILISILVIAVIGTGYWGYQENQEKNSILIKAENQYQRAFHDLNFHIDALNDELGKALAVNSRRQLSPSLANAWRLAYSAQADVSQLPLILLPFNKTEEFLAKVANFSYRIAIRDLDKEPLTDSEYKTLKTLYEDSKVIKKELNGVQEKVIDNQLRWMDVELALAQDDKKSDNTIIDGFKTIDKKVEEFPEIDWGPGVNNLENKEQNRKLKGSLITKEEAKKNALKFMGLSSDKKIEVENTGKDTEYEAFSVKIEDKDTIYLDVTKTGGYVVWMIINRDVEDKKLNYDQALDKANAFLKKHKYESMTPVSVEGYNGSLIFTFAYSQDDVIIYPDLVSVKVALDNGEIVGYQSVDYIYNHKERTIPSPKISSEEAKKMVNPNLKIISLKKAIIENYNSDEVLTYEITGELNENTYKIYINANTGDEEEVEKVSPDEVSLD